MQWLVAAGASVSVPLFANPDYDLIADTSPRSPCLRGFQFTASIRGP